MKRTVLIAALLAAASPAFAGNGDIDILPYGYVSQVMHAANADANARVASVKGSGDVQVAPASTKTRAQVTAETREAVRLGVAQHGEYEVVSSTPEQEAMIRRAGLRALAAKGGN